MIDRLAEKIADYLFDKIEPYLEEKFQKQQNHNEYLTMQVVDRICGEDDGKWAGLEKRIADEVASRFRI